MLRIQNLSGFGSGRPPSSAATLDKPSVPDHAFSFYDYERVYGVLKLSDLIGTVDLYANADLYNGVFVGSTLGGKRDDQLQVQRAARFIRNRFADFGMGADWTATLWFDLKDDSATSATFEIIRIRSSAPGYEVAVKARRIDTGDHVGQYEVFSVVNGSEQTIVNVTPNAYHFCALRADSGTITVDINSTQTEITAAAGGATQIDYLFLSSESQFDASTSSINFDELYIWTGETLTDGNVAYVFNAGIGRFVDRLTGQWEGTIDLPNPVWAAIASDTPTDDLVGNFDISGSDGEISNGKNGKAIYYDGTSFVGLKTSGPSITTGQLTVSCWVKLSGVGSEVFVPSGTNVFGRFDVDAGTSNAATVTGISGINSTDSVQLSPGEWHHLSITADASDVKFYANGVLLGTLPSPSSWTFDYLILTHSGGSTAWSGNASTKHYFDEATLFDEVLSGDQIAAIYNGGDGRFVNASGRFN